MTPARLPENEEERLEALNAYGVLDTEAEAAYDDLTRIAAQICGTPIALVSLVDAKRQWFKSRFGLDASETPREQAFCAHSILVPDEVLVVHDALDDARFRDNPLVQGDPRIRFYAGAPLVTPKGHPLGTLCVIDREPRRLASDELESLRALSRQVVSQLELRLSNRSLMRVAAELSSRNEELRRFTSVAAHDLQEPLRNLSLVCDLLVTDLEADLRDETHEELDFIRTSSRRMQQLVTDLLVLSRSGAAVLERRPVDLSTCLETVRQDLAVRIRETGAVLTSDPLPTVDGDETLLTQLFVNLVSNALKFVEGRRPEIHVTCGVEDGRTVFGVRDNGIGMQPEHTERIFAPFERLHGKGKYEGTGIGLAIVHQAVERHGGRIWVESTPGQGSHFRFTLEADAPIPTA